MQNLQTGRKAPSLYEGKGDGSTTPWERVRAHFGEIASTSGGRAVLVVGVGIVMALIAGTILSGTDARDASDPYALYGLRGIGDPYNPFKGWTLAAAVGGLATGLGLGLLGALLGFLANRYAWMSATALAGITVLIGDTASDPVLTLILALVAGFGSLYAGLGIVASLFISYRPPTRLPNVFGTSRWARSDELDRWGLLGMPMEDDGLNRDDDGKGLFLGVDDASGRSIVYDGDMHALTVAPTRSGKDACGIIPNLLRSDSSILLIDPKAEDTRRTLEARLAKGHIVKVVDPWAISLEPDRYGPGISKEHLACFNPLDALDADDPDLPTDAMMLADSLVIASGQERHWSDEATALIYGFLLYIVTDPREAGQRHLGRLRDILCLPPAMPTEPGKPAKLDGTLDEILMRMTLSKNPLVRASAFRLQQKDGRERAGVISTAQANTHFLDSPRIRASLARSDFSFKDLKGDVPTTVYLILPLDRMETFNRWLRLLVTSALMQLTRTPSKEGAPPVRMILNEFAALGKMKAVETAFGTMAGLGVQLWVVTQDLGQLIRLYGDKSWQTFVSNAGVFQYFGSRDYETAKYAEHLTGMTTMKKRSFSFGTNWSSGSSSGPGGSSSSSSEGGSEGTSIDDVQRPLAYADEMMTLHRDRQVLFVENRYPIAADKWWWFKACKADEEGGEPDGGLGA